jgi:hypothetical protein
MMKIVRLFWNERIFLALLVNIGAIIYIGNIVQHKDVEVDGGISSDEMENLLAKGIDVNVVKIADQKLDFEDLDFGQSTGQALRLAPPTIPWKPGQPILLDTKPLPGSPINWGYIKPETQQ